MAFNQQRVKSYSQGAQTAFTAPLAAFKGSQIALNTLVAGTTASTAGLVIALAGAQFNIEWESLVALVETDLTTSGITASTKWQGSLDGTNWVDIVNILGTITPVQNQIIPAIQYAAAGTGSLVTKQYFHPLMGVNPGVDYVRLAVLTGAQTGAAGDNVTVSYCFRKRSFLA
jgi:hypothetical protein